MQISSQIKKYRTAMGLSQEALAEQIFVTRQTVSNWETEKSYPDLRSLLLLAELFRISLDQLIKGDVEIMKQEIQKEDVERYNRAGRKFSALVITCLLLFVPLVVFLKVWGVLIWAGVYALVLAAAFRMAKLQKNYDIHTYREIVAFSEGKSLEEAQKQQEIGKRPYQNALKFLAGGAVGIALAALAKLILSLIS